MSAKYNERVLNIEVCCQKVAVKMENLQNILLIKNLRIDQDCLRESCLYGIPDKFRPLAWRLFLEYLPADRHEWAQMLQRQRAYYSSLVENFVLRPVGTAKEGDENGEKKEHEDHPLAIDQNSQWTGYFKDNDVLKQIENDVRRLRPEIDFFQRRTAYPMEMPSSSISLSQRLNHAFLEAEEGDQLNKLAGKSFIPSSLASNGMGSRKSTESESIRSIGAVEPENEGGEKHWEVVERMLYVYAKANSGVGYVQGMNELLGPIYYVFASDPDEEWARHAEADSFYCFQHLMSEMQDIFIRKMDGEHCGIEAELVRFYAHLAENDPALHKHLVLNQEIKAEFFAFRWISLLLSQEFSLPDLIAIWDHLFASKSGTRLQRVECLCLAMLEELRDQLLAGDFSTNLRLLQNFPDHLDVSQFVIRAIEISEGQTTQQNLEAKEKSAKNGGNRMFGVLPSTAAVKSRFATPFKSLIADTAAKLSSRIGASSSSRKPAPERTTTEERQWKNATL